MTPFLYVRLPGRSGHTTYERTWRSTRIAHAPDRSEGRLWESGSAGTSDAIGPFTTSRRDRNPRFGSTIVRIQEVYRVASSDSSDDGKSLRSGARTREVATSRAHTADLGRTQLIGISAIAVRNGHSNQLTYEHAGQSARVTQSSPRSCSRGGTFATSRSASPQSGQFDGMAWPSGSQRHDQSV